MHAGASRAGAGCSTQATGSITAGDSDDRQRLRRGDRIAARGDSLAGQAFHLSAAQTHRSQRTGEAGSSSSRRSRCARTLQSVKRLVREAGSPFRVHWRLRRLSGCARHRLPSCCSSTAWTACTPVLVPESNRVRVQRTAKAWVSAGPLPFGGGPAETRQGLRARGTRVVGSSRP